MPQGASGRVTATVRRYRQCFGSLAFNTEGGPHAGEGREALDACERLSAEIARLRAAAPSEKRFPKQVHLNLELKRFEAERAAAPGRL